MQSSKHIILIILFRKIAVHTSIINMAIFFLPKKCSTSSKPNSLHVRTPLLHEQPWKREIERNNCLLINLFPIEATKYYLNNMKTFTHDSYQNFRSQIPASPSEAVTFHQCWSGMKHSIQPFFTGILHIMPAQLQSFPVFLHGQETGLLLFNRLQSSIRFMHEQHADPTSSLDVNQHWQSSFPTKTPKILNII